MKVVDGVLFAHRIRQQVILIIDKVYTKCIIREWWQMNNM